MNTRSLAVHRPLSAPGSNSITERPAWDERHHLAFSRENHKLTRGERDYFDRPKDLRLKFDGGMSMGHDGISDPFERSPSLHYLHYRDSPKWNAQKKLRSESSPHASEMEEPQSPKTPTSPKSYVAPYTPEAAVGSPYGTATKPDFLRTGSWNLEVEKQSSSKTREHKGPEKGSRHYSHTHGTMHKTVHREFTEGAIVVIAGIKDKALLELNGKQAKIVNLESDYDSKRAEVRMAEHFTGDGAPSVLVRHGGAQVVLDGVKALRSMKPLHRSSGRLLRLATDEEPHRYEVKLDSDGSVHSVPIMGVVFLVPHFALRVPWNNRWQMNPSNYGSVLCHAYREYFASPSQLYSATSDAWRHMYGDGCENLADGRRSPGTPQPTEVYGFHRLRTLSPNKSGSPSRRSRSTSSPGKMRLEVMELPPKEEAAVVS